MFLEQKQEFANSDDNGWMQEEKVICVMIQCALL
jgi:hypothetical protein